MLYTLSSMKHIQCYITDINITIAIDCIYIRNYTVFMSKINSCIGFR